MWFFKKEIKAEILFLLPWVTAIVIISASIGLLLFEVTGGANKYVNRSLLVSKIELSISKGAELEDIVQIFKNRKHVRRPLFSGLFGNKEKSLEGYYKEPISMQKVLRDLKAELFLKDNVNQELVEVIKSKLNEHIKTDPFNKLEPGQKVHFEAVQTKLADKYSDIQININRIVDELDNKNQLVVKYLTDATLSYRISIIALIIGLFALVPQIIRAWKSWRKKSVESVK